MIGVTHSLANINNLRSVYPNPADIELFPGGKKRDRNWIKQLECCDVETSSNILLDLQI